MIGGAVTIMTVIAIATATAITEMASARANQVKVMIVAALRPHKLNVNGFIRCHHNLFGINGFLWAAIIFIGQGKPNDIQTS